MTAFTQQAGRTKLHAGQLASPYSPNWLLHTTSGNGETEPVTDNAPVAVTGYLRRLRQPVLGTNGPQYVGETRYIFVCGADQPVAAGTITNVEQPAVAFQLLTVAQTGDVLEWTATAVAV